MALNLIRLALDEVHQIGQLILGETEIGQAESVLVVVQLPADYSRAELDVVGAPGPSYRALLLEYVINVEDGNKAIVAECEAAAYAPHGHDVNSG